MTNSDAKPAKPVKSASQPFADIPPAAPLGDWVTVKAKRLTNAPIISPAMFKDPKEGQNINGPALIRAPSWIAKPLGKYYLYFANHSGGYIRLAYADALAGPWKLQEGGVLSLDQLPVHMDHIASPEILLDKDANRLIMYYHGTVRPGDGNKPSNLYRWSGQLTFAATSTDGVTFAPRGDVLAGFYLRVFPWEGKFYGFCKRGNFGGQICRADDPLSAFKPGPVVFPNARHFALLPKGDTLWVFLSQGGDAPEHILMTRVSLKGDWTKWDANIPPLVSVLKPQETWEGTQYPIKPSDWGSGVKVQELRDPFVFEEDGKLYLLYSVAGEMGIAIAELEFDPSDKGPRPGK
jgi:hypothetical protein